MLENNLYQVVGKCTLSVLFGEHDVTGKSLPHFVQLGKLIHKI